MAPACRLAAGRPVSRRPVADRHGQKAAQKVNMRLVHLIARRARLTKEWFGPHFGFVNSSYGFPQNGQFVSPALISRRDLPH